MQRHIPIRNTREAVEDIQVMGIENLVIPQLAVAALNPLVQPEIGPRGVVDGQDGVGTTGHKDRWLAPQVARRANLLNAISNTL